MSIEIHTLSNGFRVVTEHLPGLASAALGVWIDVGARHERADQNGIAHFLEHMAFKGTSTRSARQIAESIEDVGGYLNAYTSRETTAYYARVLGPDVPLAIDIISDILRDSTLAEHEIAVERHVILQEIGQSHDTPDDVIFDWLQEAAFPDQPMGRPILGPAERVRSFSRNDLAGFINGNYLPGRMILAAAGDIDHAEVLKLAEERFGDMSPVDVPRAEPARYGGAERREVKGLEQAHFAMAFEAPERLSPDFYNAQILATALGGGMSSRLFQEAREERGLCYSIFAQANAWIDSGMMTIYAGTGGEDLPGLIELTATEIARAAQDLSEVEVARARAQMKAGLLMGLESTSVRAERLAKMVSIRGYVPDLEETIARIDATSVEGARALAARLCRTRPALALYGPVGSAPGQDAIAARLAA